VTPLELRDADDAAWAVYADELVARGDLRGELIHLQLSPTRFVDRERALLATSDALGGPQQSLAALDATWRRGFLSRVRAPSASALRVLLTHPSGALLDTLVFDNPHVALDELVASVGRSQHAGLRELELRSDSAGTNFEGEVGLGEVLTLPGLRRLSASVRELSLSTRRARTSRVETLELSARELPLHVLATWAFPNLRRLELSLLNSAVWTRRWNGLAADVPIEWRAVDVSVALARGAGMPKLEVLTLANWIVDDMGATGLLELGAALPAVQFDVRACRVEPRARERLAPLGTRVLLPT
jgi:hypothetical protein